uniref:Uncharacterized protein n=1 Tax=Marseillevirus LCMAC102 TaxID=2506603 RepID=A0A481YTJ0_9VIRU|nr:MAG: hypothetical protein LCMAC102_04290 [Marseillevirus LCMAC102]
MKNDIFWPQKINLLIMGKHSGLDFPSGKSFEFGYFYDEYYLKDVNEAKNNQISVTIDLIKSFLNKYLASLNQQQFLSKKELEQLTYIPKLFQLDDDMFIWTLSQFQQPKIMKYCSMEKMDLRAIAIMARFVNGGYIYCG